MPRTLRNAIITIVVTFVVFVTSLILRTSEYLSTELDPTHFAFSLSIIVALFGLILTLVSALAAHEENMNKAVKEMTSAISEEQSFRIIGSPSDGIKYIFSNLSDVISVDNTYIRYKDYSHIDDSLYPENWHFNVVNIVKDFCKSGRSPRIWRDVISDDEKRRREISSHILADPSVTSYFVKLVDSTPVINYIVLNRQNNKREVLFGWATIKDYPTNMLVFSTKNPMLAEYFSHHFNILFNTGKDFEVTTDEKKR